jgi:hypothetical protein
MMLSVVHVAFLLCMLSALDFCVVSDRVVKLAAAGLHKDDLQFGSLVVTAPFLVTQYLW